MTLIFSFSHFLSHLKPFPTSLKALFDQTTMNKRFYYENLSDNMAYSTKLNGESTRLLSLVFRINKREIQIIYKLLDFTAKL